MEFIDTHCHIQFPDYPLAQDQVIEAANRAGVTGMIAVGCSPSDSALAVELAAQRPGQVWASVGIHPHEAKVYADDEPALSQLKALAAQPGVVAIGECGLDYYYLHSEAEAQKKLMRQQLEIALNQDLPLIFHVRQAFADFWEVMDDYSGIRGVVHSFSAGTKELKQILQRGLYVGLNGIMTFTKQPDQLEAAQMVPLERLVLETDAPFLTPVPFRGKICEPKHVRVTAEFLSGLRGETVAEIAQATTANARHLFNI